MGRSRGYANGLLRWSVALVILLPAFASGQYTAPSSPAGARSQEYLPSLSEDPRRPPFSGERRALEVTPTLWLQETYTDNVRLRPSGSERSDWVTQVRPGVAVVGEGARLRFRANYAAEFLYRLQEESKDILHYLNASANAELVRQFFFIDASAYVNQQDISLLGPQSESNVNETGNRTTVRTVRLSPYLRHNFGHDVQAEMRYTYSAVDSSAVTSNADSEGNGIRLRMASGPTYKLLTWNVEYSKERIDYTQGQDLDLEVFTVGGKRLITPTIGVLASVGYEDNNYITAGPEPKGSFWSAGAEWTPTPRTRLAATTGRRWFGSTQSLDFRHRTRLTTWGLDYTEEVTTQRQQLLAPGTAATADFLDSLFISQFPDPVARERAIQSFITQSGLPPELTVPLNFLTTTPFLQKRWRASFGIQGVRNTVLANLFTSRRDATVGGLSGAGDFGTSLSTKQTGGSVSWILRITPQTSSNLGVGYTRNEFPGIAREDEIKSIRLSFTRQFQPNLYGVLSFRRLDNDSNQVGAGYTENAVSAALNMRF